MKFFVSILVITASAIVFIGLFNKPLFAQMTSVFYYSPCDRPITYKIGVVDKRFQISRFAFSDNVDRAATIWNQTFGKNLFQEDPDGELTVHLIFDERAALTNQISELDEKLNLEKSSLDPEIAEYERRSREFEERLKNLNRQIAHWNSQGGAPEDVYKKLITEQQELQQEANALNAMAQRLNQSTSEYNAQVYRLNQTVDTFNAALSEKPEQGIYDPQEYAIAIYFNNDKEELLHTLAHEFGHARGLPHISVRDAIMYPKTTEVIIPSIEDLQAMQEVCQRKDILTLTAERFQVIMNRLSQPYIKPS